MAISIYQLNRINKQKKEEERKKVTGIFSRILEHHVDAAIYYREFNSDIYDYMGKGIKDITGYEPRKFTLTFWKKIIIEVERTGDLAGLSLDEIFQLTRTGKLDHWVADLKIQTKSGEIGWVRDITTAIHDQSGNISEIFGIMFDITDRKQAEQKLAHISEELTIQKQVLEDRVQERTRELIGANRDLVREMGEHKK
jgi:PAS domain S-box-containing protein